MKTSKRIVLFFDVLFLVLVLISVFAYFQISKKVLNYMQEEKIHVAKDILIKESLSIKNYIDLRLHETDKQVKNELKERFKYGFFLMDYLYKTAKKQNIGDKNIKSIVVNLLRRITFRHGLEYFYILDKNGNLLMNSAFPELEGKNALNLKGGDGKYFVREILRKALTEKEGLIEYYWRYKDTDKLKKKVTYFGLFKPYNWILGVTVFYEDVINEVKRDILDKLKNVVFSQEIYGIIIDQKTKKILLQINDFGHFNIPKNYPLMTFSEFVSDDVKYLYHVYPVDSAGWDIFIFTPYSRIESLTSLVRAQYYDFVRGYVQFYIIVIIFFIILHLYGTFYVHKKIMEDFEKLAKFIVNADAENKDFEFKFYELQEIKDLYENVLEQIKEEKSLREILLENLDKGILLLNDDLTIEYVNSAAEDILNVEKEKLIGKKFFDVLRIYDIETGLPIPPEDCYLGKFDYEEKVSRRLYLSAVENGKVPVKVSYLFLEMEGKKKPFIVFEDITEQIEKEKQLMELKEKAEEVSEIKSQFIANMSHEIRTPLTGIIGFVDLLLKTKLDDEQRKYLDIINQSSQSLLGIINDILEASKIERKKIVLEKRNFNLRVLINECVNTFMSNALQKGIKIVVDIGKDVPDNLKGDKFRLTQVINNLIGNAVKFTKKGEIRVSVKKVGEEPGRVKLRFSVKDTGIGIPKDKQKTIFDAFVQADLSNTRKFGGTGLGLHISYEIIKMMGGELKVESEEGKGTEFYFELEFELGDTIEIVDVSEEENFKGVKVLVAEDDVFNQEFFKIVFQRFDIDVDIVSDAKEAIKKLSEKNYDIVFMDIEMPVMGGVDFVNILKRKTDYEGDDELKLLIDKMRNKKFVLIALTGHTEEEFIEELLEIGFDDYVSKPVDVEELGRILKKYAKGKEEETLEKYFDFNELENIVGDVYRFLGNVLGKFLDGLKGNLADIKEAVSNEDFEEVKKIAHAIKGAAGNIRAKQIFEYAKGLEMAANYENKEEVLKIVKNIEEIISRIEGCYNDENKNINP